MPIKKQNKNKPQDKQLWEITSVTVLAWWKKRPFSVGEGRLLAPMGTINTSQKQQKFISPC